MAKPVTTYLHVASPNCPNSDLIFFPPVSNDPLWSSTHLGPWTLALQSFHASCENHSPELCCCPWPVTCTATGMMEPTCSSAPARTWSSLCLGTSNVFNHWHYQSPGWRPLRICQKKWPWLKTFKHPWFSGSPPASHPYPKSQATGPTLLVSLKEGISHSYDENRELLVFLVCVGSGILQHDKEGHSRILGSELLFLASWGNYCQEWWEIIRLNNHMVYIFNLYV